MLRITIQDTPIHTLLRVEGKLAGPEVGELEQCWQRAAEARPGQSFRVDLGEVTYIDCSGKQLLARMHAAGLELLATAPWSRAIVEQLSKSAGVLAIALLMAAGGAHAQQPATIKLTLREAVQTALRQNPQVQIAGLNFAQSQQQDIMARAGLLPQVGIDNSERVQRFNIEALLGKPFPGIPQHAGPFGVFQGGAGFSVPVLDLTLWRRWRSSQRNTGAVDAQRMATREQVAALVISQYLGAMRASADVEAARSRTELAQALFTQASDLQKAGVGTGIDTLRANVQLQNERQRLIGAETQLKTSLFGLARLLNLDPRQNVELADRMGFFETPPVNVDETLTAAFTNRPEIKALRLREEALELQKAAARAERYPKLRFDGNWGYQGLKTPTAAIPSYNYGVSLDFPLFTGGRIGAETASADIEARKNREQQQDTRNLVALEVKTAAAQLESARNEVDVANLGVNLAREEVSQARDRFQAGVANNIEVISAQDALARASDNQIVALYRYNQARADLAHAAGQAEALYAK